MASIIPRWVNEGFVGLLRPIPRLLIAWGVHPNAITTAGFVVTTSAGLCFFLGRLHLAGVLVILGGIFDILDGQVARGSGRSSVFGSFYDATLDRMSEIVVFLGILSLYAGADPEFPLPWMIYVVALGMTGSLMVSYTRARAEVMGLDCKVGLMQRPERVVLVGFAAGFFGDAGGGVVLTGALLLLAVLTNLTVLQRILWVYRRTRGPTAG